MLKDAEACAASAVSGFNDREDRKLQDSRRPQSIQTKVESARGITAFETEKIATPANCNRKVPFICIAGLEAYIVVCFLIIFKVNIEGSECPTNDLQGSIRSSRLGAFTLQGILIIPLCVIATNFANFRKTLLVPACAAAPFIFALVLMTHQDVKPSICGRGDFEYRGLGRCEVQNTSLTGEANKWLKMCNLLSTSTNPLFFSKSVSKKYGLDTSDVWNIYNPLKDFAAGFHSAVAAMVSEKIDGIGMSVLDYAVCYALFVPCTPNCEPMRPCDGSARNLLRFVDDVEQVRNLLEENCENIDKVLPKQAFEVVKGLGMDHFISLAEDLFRGFSTGCDNALHFLFQDAIANFSTSCVGIENYTSVMRGERRQAKGDAQVIRGKGATRVRS